MGTQIMTSSININIKSTSEEQDTQISADPCRQQGERVRGGLTSNKGRRGKIGQARPPAGRLALWAGKSKV